MKSRMNLLANLICPALMACSMPASAVLTQIAGTSDHTLFIDSGNVYGFGISTYGSTPTGEIVPGSTVVNHPAPTFTGVGNAKSVTTGLRRSAALLNDGSVKVWGMAAEGVMAPTTYTIPTPGTVTDIALSQTKIYYIISGQVYEWGFTGTPALLSDTVTGTATAVAAGVDHILVLYSDGSVGSYGNNAYGQLGNGSTTPLTIVTKLVGISGATNIAVAGSTSLVTLNSGTVFGFGRNQNGQLGTGEKTNKLSPIVVTDIAGATKIYGGDSYVAALTSSGTLRAAGFHNYIDGAIYTSSTTFVDIPNVAGVVDVGGGTNTHTLSTGAPGQLKGWGGGTVSVGDGTNVEKHIVVPIAYNALASSIVVEAPPAPVVAPVVVAAAPPVVPAPAPVVTTTPPVVTVVAPTVLATTPVSYKDRDREHERERERSHPQCKLGVKSSPWAHIDDNDAYNCGIKVYKYTTECVKAHSKDKFINTVALCTEISDDGDKINCNNGWGNGKQCAPGKSEDNAHGSPNSNDKYVDKYQTTGNMKVDDKEKTCSAKKESKETVVAKNEPQKKK